MKIEGERKPTVLVDVDGVLCDFVSGMLRVVYEVTGLEYDPIHVTEFDVCASLGLGREDASLVKRTIGSRPGFCRDLHPYPDARAGMKALREVAEVYIVTAPWNSNPTWMSEREAWLDHHFDIPHSRVIHCAAKHLVRGDIFVDDKSSTVAAWRDANPDGDGVVWDTLHNRRELVQPRIYNWADLVSLVQRRRLEAGLAELREAPVDRPRTFLDADVHDPGGEGG